MAAAALDWSPWSIQPMYQHRPRSFSPAMGAFPQASMPLMMPQPEPALPPRNEKELSREMLISVLNYFSTLIPVHFNGRPVRLIVHGGACMLLHTQLYQLANQQPPMAMGSLHAPDAQLPKRRSTRDVDIIKRSFVTEWQQAGVPDAADRLQKCINFTARQFGLGLDWMNSDADVALPMSNDPSTGAQYDPIYNAAIQPNNVDLHTIFESDNKMLKLISVTPFWAVALKLVRYTKWDPGDICILLKNGRNLSGIRWTTDLLEGWLFSNCSPMGYAHYDSRRLAEMQGRIQHAVQMISQWMPDDAEAARMQQVLLNGRAITADMAMGGSEAASSPAPRSPREALMEAQLRNRSRSKTHSDRDKERERRHRSSSRSGGSNQPSPSGLQYLDPHPSPHTEHPSSSSHRHSTVSRHSSGSRQSTPQHSPWHHATGLKTIEEFDRSVSTMLRSNPTPSSSRQQPAWRHSRHQSAAPALASSNSQGSDHRSSTASSQAQAAAATQAVDSARRKYERDRREKERDKKRLSDRHRKWSSRDYGSSYFGHNGDDTDDTNDDEDSADDDSEESETTESESEDDGVGQVDLPKSIPPSTSRDVHRSMSAHNIRPAPMSKTSPLKQQATMPTLSGLPPGFQPFLGMATAPTPTPQQQMARAFSPVPPMPTPSPAALAAGMQRMSLTSPVPPTYPISPMPPASSNAVAPSGHPHSLPPPIPPFGLPQMRMPPPTTAAAFYQQQQQQGTGTTTPLPRPLTAMSSISSMLGPGPMPTPPATATFQTAYPFPGPPYMHIPVHAQGPAPGHGFGMSQVVQGQPLQQYQSSHGMGHGHGHMHPGSRPGHGGHTQSMSALPGLSTFSSSMARPDELSPILPSLPPPSNALGLY